MRHGPCPLDLPRGVVHACESRSRAGERARYVIARPERLTNDHTDPGTDCDGLQLFVRAHAAEPGESHPNRFFIAAYLAAKNLAPKPDRAFPFDVWYGYHFDAVLLGEYLHKKAVERGVRYTKCHVTGVQMNEAGEIASVSIQDGDPV